MRQLLFALLDMSLHTVKPEAVSPARFAPSPAIYLRKPLCRRTVNPP